MKLRSAFFAALLVQGAVAHSSPEAIQQSIDAAISAAHAAEKQAGGYRYFEIPFPVNTRLLSVKVEDEKVVLTFDQWLAARLWNAEERVGLEQHLRAAAGENIPPEKPIEILIRYGTERRQEIVPFGDLPSPAAEIRARGLERTIPAPALAAPVVDRADYAGPQRNAGLSGRNIVLGPSHGWTWHKENRWQYQRARVYTIIEDLLPQSYINPFLEPMLENAGATTWNVRERDFQVGEVIVDNDGTTNMSHFEQTGEWTTTSAAGWKGGRPALLDERTEPFTLGTTISASAGSNATAVYTPYIPHQGRYAVYASWSIAPENSASVPMEIRHLGGTTTVRVNQQVAGGTWVFLGFFEFDQGADTTKGSVTVRADEATLTNGDRTRITADAIRFGGGMGNIAPMDSVGHKPRFTEGSRYFLQYAGAPADTVYLLDFDASRHHFGIDYIRDIAARAEWPNYLMGAPGGPNANREHPGLGVPVDMFLAWHTDAGHDEHGLIGTLSIWRLFGERGESTFPDGRSRLLNRDLTMLMHEEIMRTGRELYSSTWRPRAVQERDLGETRRPNVPSTLLELYSHHNFHDMKYGTDPRFKRDMCRAIYKAILRFIAYQEGYEPIVQPLEPTHLAAFINDDQTATITWREQPDPMEPTATADGYIVYTSIDGRSFDNGIFVDSDSHTTTPLESGETRFYRVTAANAGGESLPSRVVGVRWVQDSEPILIVDGFDRISGATVVHERSTQGFDRNDDPGVGYLYNYGVVGDQYDFDPESPWANDLETPGMGGSQMGIEDRPELGNTFNHIVAHAAALGEERSFNSATAEAFASGDIPAEHRTINWIAGRQRTTMPYPGEVKNGAPDRMRPEFEVFTAEVRAALRTHVANGGNLVVSGAHIAEDLLDGGLANDDSRDFARTVLGIDVYTPRATSTNTVRAVTPSETGLGAIKPFRFGRDLEPPINILPTVYRVISAESFASRTGAPFLEYGDTAQPAAITLGNVVLMGFPLETVMPPARRTEILHAALNTIEEW